MMAEHDEVLLVFTSTLLSLTFIFWFINVRQGSPVVAIFARWFRWITVSVSGAFILYSMEMSVRPYWIIAVTVFLAWFLLETIYNWMAVTALSRSNLPLFPSFRLNENGNEWPNNEQFIKLRDWLRKEGFKATEAVFSEIDPEIILRSSIFDNEVKTVRLQVLFMPQRGGHLTSCCILTSVLKDGTRIITDNFYLPFGGFYPENWLLKRKPWTRSAKRLLTCHKERLEEHKDALVPFDNEPLEDIDDQQLLLEKTNVEMGFLFPRPLREDHGKITWEGRYRVWKELWMLSYLGRSFNY